MTFAGKTSAKGSEAAESYCMIVAPRKYSFRERLSLRCWCFIIGGFADTPYLTISIAIESLFPGLDINSRIEEADAKILYSYM